MQTADAVNTANSVDITVEKRQVEQGRGLALLGFLCILLLFIVLRGVFLSKRGEVTFAALAVNQSGKLILRQYHEAGEEYSLLTGKEREKFSSFLFGKMNINTAPFTKLTTIRGVGKKMAAEICRLRQKKKFTKTDDLLRLNSVGTKRAMYLEKFFHFGAEHSAGEIGQ